MTNIDRFLHGQIDKNQTPSIQYAHFSTDSILFEKSIGLANIQSNSYVSADTEYNLFSITKTFTALAIMQLVEQGDIKLDDSIGSYLSDIPYDGKITISQLLNHTSGFTNPIPLKWIHTEREHFTFQRDHFFTEILKQNSSLDFEPGSKFKYSNLGYIILGQLLEKATGIAFEDYIKDHIIRTSGISSDQLSFNIHPEIHATGYQKWWSFGNVILEFLIDKKKYMEHKEGKWKPFVNFYTNGTSYGGLFGTSKGLIQYAQTLLRPNSPLLNDTLKQLLFQENKINGKGTGMAMSWYTGSLKGHKYICHAGGGGGYYVELRLYPELGKGSVILFNRTGMKDERILDQADSFFL